MAAMPPPWSWLDVFLVGCAILMYAPKIHMHTEPPAAPMSNNIRRPRWSIRYNSQTNVTAVFTQPNTPVVNKLALAPWTPMLLNTVGL
jgi:hypothetical protein